ncbi:MAG: hypothetical protein H0U27_06710 [Nitrosopumilus sp.]|nr:hypothetical protein [Nitrosopumilus sp.]
MKCIYKKLNGDQCKANSMTNVEYCFTHNPETQERKRQAVIKGGLTPKTRKEFRYLKPISLKEVPDTLPILEDAINRVRSGPMTPDRANAIGFLMTLVSKMMDKRQEYQRDLNMKEKMSELFKSPN